VFDSIDKRKSISSYVNNTSNARKINQRVILTGISWQAKIYAQKNNIKIRTKNNSKNIYCNNTIKKNII